LTVTVGFSVGNKNTLAFVGVGDRKYSLGLELNESKKTINVPKTINVEKNIIKKGLFFIFTPYQHYTHFC